MKKYSLIVPLYNTEKYIVQCIESVINQDYDNWELIIINDGSIDNSKSIVEEYLKKDSRIKLINQDNSGVSIARNNGLKEATGDYIIFLDSDDWIENNALSIISKYDSDFIVIGFNKCYVDRTDNIIDSNLTIDNVESAVRNIYTNDKIQGFLCTKVYRRSIITDHNMNFNSKIRICEDLLFIDEFVKYCSSFKYVSVPLYNYRMRKSSVSFSMLKNKDTSSLDAYYSLIEKNKDLPEVVSFLQYYYLCNYYKVKKYCNSKQNEYANKILKNKKKIFSDCKLGLSSKIRFYIVKYWYRLFIVLLKLKNKKMNLFD